MAIVGLAAMRAHADDEFDDTASASAAAASKITAAPTVKTPWDFPLEIGGAVLVLVYIILFIVSRFRNGSAATPIFAALRAPLRAQFAQTGIKADDPETGVSRVADDEFEMWSSGRRNCKGALVTCKLEGGNILASLTALAGSAPAAVSTVTVEIPLDESVEPFVFAAMRATEKKTILEGRQDLQRFSQRFSGKEFGLPDTLDTHADHREVVESTLQAGLAQLMQPLKDYIRVVHITDQSEMAGNQTYALSQRCLSATLVLPPSSRYADLASFVEGLVTFTDTLAALRLPPAARARVSEQRDKYRRELERRIAEADAERLREEKERVKREEDKKRRAKMSPKELAKLEEKEREAEMRKAAKQLRMMPRFKAMG